MDLALREIIDQCDHDLMELNRINLGDINKELLTSTLMTSVVKKATSRLETILELLKSDEIMNETTKLYGFLKNEFMPSKHDTTSNVVKTVQENILQKTEPAVPAHLTPLLRPHKKGIMKILIGRIDAWLRMMDAVCSSTKETKIMPLSRIATGTQLSKEQVSGALCSMRKLGLVENLPGEGWYLLK